MTNKLINIGGQDRPVNFGRNTLIEFERLASGISIFEKFDLASFDRQRSLAYAGLKWGLYKPLEGSDPIPDFTINQVGDWIEADNKSLIEILKLFNEAMPQPTESKNAGASKSIQVEEASHGKTLI